MTTILIDFKTKKIVADRQLTCNKTDGGSAISEQVWYDFKNKIRKLHEGSYFVGSGDDTELCRQWNKLYFGGVICKEARADCDFAVVTPKGDGLFVNIYKYTEVRNWYGKKVGKFKRTVIQGNTNVITFGSGGNYAYGAFMAGCSAEDSVRAASRCDEFTSFEIDVITLGE